MVNLTYIDPVDTVTATFPTHPMYFTCWMHFANNQSSQKFLDQSKITSEPWHSSSNEHMSIAKYLPKNWEQCWMISMSP